ncbi:unnamed protein product [Withania somnifera]
MEDGAFTLNDMLPKLSDNNTTTDFSELLSDGFWLETTHQGSNFSALPFTTSTLTSQPLLFSNVVAHSIPTTNQVTTFQQETEKDKIVDILFVPQMEEFSAPTTQNTRNSPHPDSSGQLPCFPVEGTQTNRRLWIRPNSLTDPNPTLSVNMRLVQAIEYLKNSTRDKDVLIQIWVPVKRGGKHVLITNNQPYFLNPNSQSLLEYRHVSQNYQFAAEKDSKELVGLPGRVFLKRLPEWTPDVRFFKREEYPRVNYAHQHNVRGSIAVPVFESGIGTCLGVVEIVTTIQKTHYHPELEDVCKALETVNLRSSGISSNPAKVKDRNESYLAALAEIHYILTCVCDTHKLPLAQTWAPCIQQGKGGCPQSDENFASCISTVDSACYVRDPQVVPFHFACSEHHLLKGEGVAGGAFSTNQPCFATDITAFSKAEYPLSHHARMFGLCSAVAIHLRSIYTGSADFVLEFFFPLDCKNTEDQKQMLSSLSSVIQQSCRSLRVVTDEELQEEKELLQRENVSLSVGGSYEEESRKPVSPTYRDSSDQDASSWLSEMMDAQRKGKGTAVSESQKDEQEENFKVTATSWDYTLRESIHASTFSEPNENFEPKGGSFDFFSVTGSHSSGSKRAGERRRSKTEKNISLQVLRQYFAGSLKDAAKSIGVCPTTLKRICRQHGIARWPSRKIKKVGHSLQKLQLVIDSVHGAEGAIKLSSFYTNFPDLSPPNNPRTSYLSASKNDDHLQQVNTQPDGSLVTTTSKSTSSSGSHNSSSSLFGSTGSKNLFPSTNVFPTGNATTEEHPGGMLKRAHTETELHDMGQEETKLLVRSQSQKIQQNHNSLEPFCPLQMSSNQVLRDSGTFKLTANFGKEKIRFSLHSHWGFGDVQHEILRRFNVEDVGKIDLKYLDDDDEWVLLTCDADLEECIHIHKLSKRRTIKVSLHHTYHPNLGSSFGSSGPA